MAATSTSAATAPPPAKLNTNRLVGEWLAHGRHLPESGRQLTVSELILAYWKHVESYYRRPDGTPTGEADIIRLALRPLRRLYGHTSAAEFGPLALKAVREHMVALGWCRSSVNKQIGRVKAMFRWATENELIPPSVYHGLQAVAGLRRGSTEAPEPKKIKPVPEAFVEAVKPLVAPQIRAMMELQILAAMRPNEACIMRTCGLDVGGRVWIYKPSQHKTEHHDHERLIYLGPKAQEVLKPWLRTNLEDVFSPAEWEKERNGKRRENRKTPLWPSHVQAQERKKKRRPRARFADHYDVHAYRRAIHRACDQAGVPRWSPNRLRHNAATNLRKEFGIELARIILGHTTIIPTQVYAEQDKAAAMAVIERVG